MTTDTEAKTDECPDHIASGSCVKCLHRRITALEAQLAEKDEALRYAKDAAIQMGAIHGGQRAELEARLAAAEKERDENEAKGMTWHGMAKRWEEIAKAAEARLAAAEKERDEEAKNGSEWRGKMYTERARADAAESRIGALTKALEDIAQSGAELSSSIARRALAQPAKAEGEVKPRHFKRLQDLPSPLDSESATVRHEYHAESVRIAREQARREAFEEAAKVLESGSHIHDEAPSAIWARQVAAKIRALADAPKKIDLAKVVPVEGEPVVHGIPPERQTAADDVDCACGMMEGRAVYCAEHKPKPDAGEARATMDGEPVFFPRNSLCVECGPNVVVDEDGCCALCGNGAMGEWLDQRSLDHDHEKKEVERLKAELAEACKAAKMASEQRDSAAEAHKAARAEATRLREALGQSEHALAWVDANWTSAKAARGDGLPMCRAALSRARVELVKGNAALGAKP